MISLSNLQLPFIFLIILSFLIFNSCDKTVREDVPDPAADQLSDEQLAFWDNIQSHCGNAYEGILADATPYYQMDEEHFVIHVRDCTDTLTHISLHIDGDNSRNLMLTKADGTLRLKHDHRNPDGTEEEITQYGGDAPKPGLETRQIFWADAHTASILPLRDDNFWFLDIMDEKTLAYGVHWPREGHSIRIEFDTSQTVEKPDDPWGYERD